MAKLKFDVSGEDAEKATTVKIFETPPVGLYPAKITSAVLEKPEGKNERIVVKCAITKPAKNNYGQLVEYVTLTEASAWKLDQLLQATGAASKTKRKGEVEDKFFVNKMIQIYVQHETDSFTPAGATEPVTRTRARIANFLPKTARIDGLAGPAAAADEEEEEEATEDEQDLDTLGAAADDDDEDAINALTDAAAEVDLDPNDYETWAELATAIQGAGGEEEEEEEVEKEEVEEEEEEGDDLDALAEAADENDDEESQGRLSEIAVDLSLEPDEYATWADLAVAISEAQAESETEEEEGEEVPDYESMKLLDLKKLCKERELPSTGSKEAMIERLQEFDNTDPFKE